LPKRQGRRRRKAFADRQTLQVTEATFMAGRHRVEARMPSAGWLMIEDKDKKGSRA